MYCTKCGKQIRDDSKVCPSCGTPTGGGQKPKRSIFTRVLLGVGVWLASVILIAVIGTLLRLAERGQVLSNIYSLTVVIVPVLLTMMTAMPEQIMGKKPPKPAPAKQPPAKAETPPPPAPIPAKTAPVEPVAKQTPNVYVSLRGYEKRDRPARGRSLTTTVEDFVVLDLETTGLSPTACEIIEIACIRYRGGVETDSFVSLIKPGDMDAMTDLIVNLTGITPAMLQDAPTAAEVLPQALTFIGQDVVVGHNVAFDVNFLYDHAQRLGLGSFTNDYIDTLRLARSLFPEWKDHKLKTLVKEFGIGESVAHRAAGDARQTAQCYQYMTKQPQKKQATEERAAPAPTVCISSPGLALSGMETAFVARISAILQEHPAFDKVEVQRRSDNYWTMVAGRNDFLRFKYTDRAKWISLDLPTHLREKNRENPAFAAQKNKNQRHWKASITGLNDLNDLADFITAACVEK